MDGIIPLWKERGMTSHDCVFKLRKILKTKKIGHGGTLDPDVDGILPICVGKGTKVIEYMQDSGKIYIGEITLGYATTTEDGSGEVIEQKDVSANITSNEIDEAMNKMLGSITQVPPMYSAVKVNGKRLYEYARAGLEVERPKRIAEIYEFKRTSEPVYNKDNRTVSWRFSVSCGKGTYVRTLSVDTGKLLGYPAHMSDLTRTSSGGLTEKNAFTLEEIANKFEEGNMDFLQPIENGIINFQRIDISDEDYQKVRNGVFLAISDYTLEDENAIVAVFYQGLVVSLYKKHPTKTEFLKPEKVLRND